MSRHLWKIVMTLLAVALIGCTASDDSTGAGTGDSASGLTADDIQRISVAEAYELQGRGEALLYDTRSMTEYRTLHVDGAAPFPEAEMHSRYSELPLDETLIFY